MSDYIIKPYNETYIENQVEIGNHFAQKWITYGQTPVDRLREVYSQDTFDPETRIYAFKEDKMVGFIGANIVENEEDKTKLAQTRLAFVLPGHEGAFDLLYNKLEGVLRKKKVSKIETPQSALNDDYYEKAEKLGYNYARTLNEIYINDLSSIKSFSTDFTMSDYNHDTDKEQVKQQLGETYPNIEGENLENYVNRTAENENTLSYKVLKDGDEILAYGAAVQTLTEGYAQFTLLIGKNPEVKKHIISEILSEVKNKGFEKIIVYQNPNLEVEKEESKDFMALGFERRATYDMLEKEL